CFACCADLQHVSEYPPAPTSSASTSTARPGLWCHHGSTRGPRRVCDRNRVVHQGRSQPPGSSRPSSAKSPVWSLTDRPMRSIAETGGGAGGANFGCQQACLLGADELLFA